MWARFRGKEHLLNPTTFNMRQVREAALPAANGHMSAAALARFYAGLVSAVDGAPRLLTPETVAACLRCADELQVRAAPATLPCHPPFPLSIIPILRQKTGKALCSTCLAAVCP